MKKQLVPNPNDDIEITEKRQIFHSTFADRIHICLFYFFAIGSMYPTENE